MKTANSTEVEASGLNLYPVVTLEFTLRATSGEHYAETDFVHSIRGRILIDGERNAEKDAGYLTATLVQFDEAMDYEITPDRLGDGFDGGISEYWERLFDPAEGRLKKEIQDEHEPLGCNLLIIDCVELWPKFRGRGVAKLAIERTIAIFGAGCGLVACKPWPLQFTSAVAHDPRLLKRLNVPEVGKEAAVSRLRNSGLNSASGPLVIPVCSSVARLSRALASRTCVFRPKSVSFLTSPPVPVRTLPCHRIFTPPDIDKNSIP